MAGAEAVSNPRGHAKKREVMIIIIMSLTSVRMAGLGF